MRRDGRLLAAAHRALPDALAGYFRSLGGTIVTGAEVRALKDMPPADVTLFDTSAKALGEIAGTALASSFQRRLRDAKAGPGIFKIDYALREPIPWRDPTCKRAATVHVAGTLEEIVRAEDDAFYAKSTGGKINARPFVLLTQPSLFDPSRAPAGQHTAWAYCHVAHGSNVDCTAIIEAQIERFAPGFRDVVLERRGWNTSALGAWNPNLAGGDISGGAMTLSGLIARPTLRTYRTGNPTLYLASASTPPGRWRAWDVRAPGRPWPRWTITQTRR